MNNFIKMKFVFGVILMLIIFFSNQKNLQKIYAQEQEDFLQCSSITTTYNHAYICIDGANKYYISTGKESSDKNIPSCSNTGVSKENNTCYSYKENSYYMNSAGIEIKIKDGEPKNPIISNSATSKTWYKDNDNDGYGNLSFKKTAETKPTGYVLDNKDCNDNDININPAKKEICGDKIDQDCNGSDLACTNNDSINANTATANTTTTKIDTDKLAKSGPENIFFIYLAILITSIYFCWRQRSMES